MTPDPVLILPAEFVGLARTVEGQLDIGGVKVTAEWSVDGTVAVYVRRESATLRVMEIHMAKHDGLAQEELDEENAEAERYPLGPKEYWRSKMVGKYRYGADAHLMTEDEFEEDWFDDSEDD